MAFNTEAKPKKAKKTPVAITAQELMTSPEYKEDFEAFLYIQKNKKRVEQFEKILKSALLTEMEANGVMEIQKGHCKITYNQAHSRKIIDSNKLKDDGIYEDYLKISNVSPSVSISYID